MNIRLVALLAALVPCLALVGAYVLSASLELVPWCMPLVEGCVSISKAARQGPTLLFFRLLMLPNCLILVLFWVLSRAWLQALGDKNLLRLRLMQWIGVAGALCLGLYLTYLGYEGGPSKLARKFGVVTYFSFSGFAQFLLVSRLYQPRLLMNWPVLTGMRRAMLTFCLLNLGLAFANIAVALLIPDLDAADNIIEWNYAVLMHLFFLVSYCAWHVTDFKTEYYVKKSN